MQIGRQCVQSLHAFGRLSAIAWSHTQNLSRFHFERRTETSSNCLSNVFRNGISTVGKHFGCMSRNSVDVFQHKASRSGTTLQSSTVRGL